MRDQLALLLPEKEHVKFLLSSSNEEHTATASFNRLGANLAHEICTHIRAENLGGRSGMRPGMWRVAWHAGMASTGGHGVACRVGISRGMRPVGISAASRCGSRAARLVITRMR